MCRACSYSLWYLLYQKNVKEGSIYQEEEEEYLGGSPESVS